MNEIAGATLVIQIFEFIRDDLRPSSTLSRFSLASLPPLILLVLLPFAASRQSLLTNSFQLLTGEHKRTSFAIKKSVYRCLSISALRACFSLPLFLPSPLFLSLFSPSLFSPRFGNNKYSCYSWNAFTTHLKSQNFLPKSDCWRLCFIYDSFNRKVRIKISVVEILVNN